MKRLLILPAAILASPGGASLRDGSPRIDGYAVGDNIAISCVDGPLTAIERLDATA